MGVEGSERVPPIHMHTHAIMHAHTRVCMYDIIGNSQGFPKNPMEAAICMKLSCLPCTHVHVCVCVCACACMCVHVHMCGGHPQPPHPIHPPCLEIWDPRTPLHTYRLGLMCRLGVSYPRWHFCVFDHKKVLL